MSADNKDTAPERVALFPLNVVLFPGGILPLRIFEPRYVRMVSECMREQKPFAVVAIVDGPEAGGVASTASIGTLARIIDWEQGDDGLLNLVCEGEQGVAIDAVQAEDDQLLRARVSRLPLPVAQPLPDEFAWAAALLLEVLQRLGEPFDRLAVVDPSADHVANRLIELLPIPLDQKQALLETDGGAERLRRLVALINPDGEDVTVA